MSFSNYIGIPWVAGAQGPEAYDCMSFFRFIQGQHFAIDVPPILTESYEDNAALVDIFAHHPERKRWDWMPNPSHGCAVYVRGPLHIGTWLNIDNGGVLHCVKGIGVIFTHDAAWAASGFGRRQFFKFVQ